MQAISTDNPFHLLRLCGSNVEAALGPLGRHAAANSQFEVVSDNTADLLVEGCMREAKDILCETGVDGDVVLGCGAIATSQERTLLDRFGEVATHDGTDVGPTRFLAEDVTHVTWDTSCVEGLYMAAGNVLNVHSGVGNGVVKALAEDEAHDEGVGALECIACSKGEVVAAFDEGWVEVYDVEVDGADRKSVV